MNTLLFAISAMVIFIILSCLLFRDDRFNTGMASVMVATLATMIALAYAGMIIFVVPREINTFELHKKYIEICDTGELQNAGLIKNKIELNQWLYKAQFGRNRFGNWSSYPASVLDLEPIK